MKSFNFILRVKMGDEATHAAAFEALKIAFGNTSAPINAAEWCEVPGELIMKRPDRTGLIFPPSGSYSE